MPDPRWYERMRAEERRKKDERHPDYAVGERVFSRKREEPEIPVEPGEEWRDVRGWEGLYKVSSHGRVWSMPRVVPVEGRHFDARRVGGRLLSGANIRATGDAIGPRYATFTQTETGRKEYKLLAALVWETFTGQAAFPTPRDGDLCNCRLDNLLMESPQPPSQPSDWMLWIGASVRVDEGNADAQAKPVD